MSKEEKLKRAMNIAHDNHHSVGIILRSVEYWLAKKDITEEKRLITLERIAKSARECKEHIDELYKLIKDE